MYPISDAVRDGLTRSHSRTTVAEVFRGSVRVLESDEVKVTGGKLQVNGGAAIRRRGTINLAVDRDSLMPANATDDLAPFGNEIRLKQIITVDNGATAEIPIGVLRISVPKGSDEGSRSLSISAFDRSRSIQRARLTLPYTVQAAQNYVTATRALVDSRKANLIWQATTTAHTTPLMLLDVKTDPWSAATKMAGSFGAELFFDPAGQIILRPEPDPTTAPPVFQYVEGESAVLLSVDTELNDEPGYNGVVVIGEPSYGLPVRSVRWDDNPASATYYRGEYGEVPTFMVSQYIATQAQADDAADAELRRVLGISETVTFTAVPNPALEAGDVIQLRRAASRVDDIYVVESFTLPFKLGEAMTVVARRRKNPS